MKNVIQLEKMDAVDFWFPDSLSNVYEGLDVDVHVTERQARFLMSHAAQFSVEDKIEIMIDNVEVNRLDILKYQEMI